MGRETAPSANLALISTPGEYAKLLAAFGTTSFEFAQHLLSEVVHATHKDEKQPLLGADADGFVEANCLLPRLTSDPALGRFWNHRGEDGVRRERQLLIEFLCASAGGPLYYVGRDMKTSHRGMGISESDWKAFVGHLEATLDKFQVPAKERAEVLTFVESTKRDIVE